MKLGVNKQRQQELRSSTQLAIFILDNVVIPICKELDFRIDVSDKEVLFRYVYDLRNLHSDYINKMSEGIRNPALSVVLLKTAEDLWAEAEGKYPLKSSGLILEKDVFDFLIISGRDIYSFDVKVNNQAIETTCSIKATQEDVEKMEEIQSVCDALNKCFNGSGQLFSLYIGVVGGKFVPVDKVINYGPLIR